MKNSWKYIFFLFFIGILVLYLTVWPLKTGVPGQQVINPGKLAIFFGWPRKVNDIDKKPSSGVYNHVLYDQWIADAANEFRIYDLVVFQQDLELPQSSCIDVSKGHEPCDYDCAHKCKNGSGGHTLNQYGYHCDHYFTDKIIKLLKAPGHKNIEVYGYITIGGSKTLRKLGPLTEKEIEKRIALWDGMKVDGVYFDEAEYGFGCSRVRQNAAIKFAHKKGLSVFINASDPDDVLDDAKELVATVGTNPLSPEQVTITHYGQTKATVTHTGHGLVTGDKVQISNASISSFDGAYYVAFVDKDTYTFDLSLVGGSIQSINAKALFQPNPDGLDTELKRGDINLLEHFQIHEGNFVNQLDHGNRAGKALKYKITKGIRIAVITSEKLYGGGKTCDNSADKNKLNSYKFDQNKFNYAWWSTFLCGFDFMGWGEPDGYSVHGPMKNKLDVRKRPYELQSGVSGYIDKRVKTGSSFTSGITKLSNGLYARDTTCGVIVVNISTQTIDGVAGHSGKFINNQGIDNNTQSLIPKKIPTLCQ